MFSHKFLYCKTWRDRYLLCAFQRETWLLARTASVLDDQTGVFVFADLVCLRKTRSTRKCARCDHLRAHRRPEDRPSRNLSCLSSRRHQEEATRRNTGILIPPTGQLRNFFPHRALLGLDLTMLFGFVLLIRFVVLLGRIL